MWRGFAVFCSGLAIGGGVLFALAPETEKHSGDSRPAGSNGEVDRLGSENRALRAELDSAVRELADARKQVQFLKPLVEQGSVQDRPAGVGQPLSAVVEKSFRDRVDAALKQQNGNQVLDLLKELQAMGEPAFPALLECLEKLGKLMMRPDARGLKLSSVLKLFPDHQFFEWALFQKREKDDIQETIGVLLFLRDPDRFAEIVTPEMLAGLNANQADELMEMLRHCDHEKALQTALEMARPDQDKRLRGEAIEILSIWDTPESIQALASLASGEPDEQLRKMARKGLGLLRPAETGLLVTYVSNDGSAGSAGLREGDIVIRCNGQPAVSEEQIRKSENGGTLEICRNGVSQALSFVGRLTEFNGQYVVRR